MSRAVNRYVVSGEYREVSARRVCFETVCAVRMPNRRVQKPPGDGTINNDGRLRYSIAYRS